MHRSREAGGNYMEDHLSRPLDFGRYAVTASCLEFVIMSYDMWFWKQSHDCRHAPSTVVERVCEDGDLHGVATLDLDAIKSQIANAFPGFEGNIYDAGTHYFTIDLYPPYAFQIVSTPPENDDVMRMLNVIIDVATEFDCALYDPQAGQRYS